MLAIQWQSVNLAFQHFMTDATDDFLTLNKKQLL